MQQNTEFIIKMEFKIHVLNLVLIYQSVYLSRALIEEQLDMTTSVNLTVKCMKLFNKVQYCRN